MATSATPLGGRRAGRGATTRMTVADLRKEAARRAIIGRSRMSREELISRLDGQAAGTEPARGSSRRPSKPRRGDAGGVSGDAGFATEGTVAVGREGRVTLPARIREQFGLSEGSRLFLDVDYEGRRLQLRPAAVVPAGQTWAYTDEHLGRVARAISDMAQGRVERLGQDDVLRLLKGDAVPAS